MELTPYDKEYHDCKEVFLDTLTKLVERYEEYITPLHSAKVAGRYMLVAQGWVDYLYGYSAHYAYDQIMVSDTNSRFFNYEKYTYLEGFTAVETKNKLKAFVYFLEENGYHNPNVIKALNK